VDVSLWLDYLAGGPLNKKIFAFLVKM